MLAKHTASRVCDTFGLSNGVVLDAFCGVGGNTIQFAKKCAFCIGVDNDPIKVEYTKHNAKIYEADSKIQIIYKDDLELSD